MCKRTMFSNKGDGRLASGIVAIPSTLREIWIGVPITPQGKPHQPTIAELAIPPSLALMPQRRQQTSGRLLQEVMNSADQMRWEVCTSTGPVPPHLGQLLLCHRDNCS